MNLNKRIAKELLLGKEDRPVFLEGGKNGKNEKEKKQI